MLTVEFETAISQLLELAEKQPTAIMCAERVYFHCHRMLVSDYLVANGHDVLHVDGVGPVRPHKLMPEAHLVEGKVIYRGDHLF